jgi:hypothetical protein
MSLPFLIADSMKVKLRTFTPSTPRDASALYLSDSLNFLMSAADEPLRRCTFASVSRSLTTMTCAPNIFDLRAAGASSKYWPILRAHSGLAL